MTPILVVSAHAADFVWRAGGAIALYARHGSRVKVLALSYGERGESAALWQQPGQDLDRVKEIRRSEALAAAEILGAEIAFLDLGDHPLQMTAQGQERIVAEVRALRPHLILTHHERDPLNPDHETAWAETIKSVRYAAAAGVMPEIAPVVRGRVFAFEPDQPELCGFVPDVFLDITAVFECKQAAMAAIQTQAFLVENYSSRAAYRGYMARRLSGDADIRYAEAYRRQYPYVGKELL